MTKKETNPKDSIGSTKLPYHLVPSEVIGGVALSLLEGALKYGAYNYRVAGVRYSIYYSAFQRHVNAWWNGEDIDKESGIPHIYKAMACLVVLADSMYIGNSNDDRPPRLEDGWVQTMNEQAKALIAKYPNPPKPFTEK